MTYYRDYGKRALDLVFSVAALALTWPVMAVLAALIAISMGRPVFFLQTRPGLHGRTFRIIKLRTMKDDPNPSTDSDSEARRLTALGRVLRSLSLDELPELFNVLKGDMSLVGPRPLLLQYLPRYNREQARRHDVRPGITGWAQINGRNAITWSEKLRLDVWYVRNVSLLLDLRILILTVGKVLRREGISSRGGPTMPEYLGDNGE